MIDAVLPLRPMPAVRDARNDLSCCSSFASGICLRKTRGQKPLYLASVDRKRAVMLRAAWWSLAKYFACMFDVFCGRRPFQIVRHVVVSHAVTVVNLMCFGWWRSIKCDTNKSVNEKRYLFSVHGKNDSNISTSFHSRFYRSSTPSSETASGACAANLSVQATDAPKVRDLVAWESFYRSPFFARLIERHVRNLVRAGIGGTSGFRPDAAAALYSAFPVGARLA